VVKGLFRDCLRPRCARGTPGDIVGPCGGLTAVLASCQINANTELIASGTLAIVFMILLHRGWVHLTGPVLFYELVCIARRFRCGGFCFSRRDIGHEVTQTAASFAQEPPDVRAGKPQ
jgi:hypothetical protein